jgi:endoglucanase
MLERRRCRAVLRGWVHAEYLPGTRVRFFTDDREITGTIESVEPERKADRGRAVSVKVSAEVPAGSAGMFDQGTGRLRGRRFLCRAIDDLGGLAAALEMLDRLSRSRAGPRAPVVGRAPRAVDVGFSGAVPASRDVALLRRTDRIIAIECSALQPYAPQGKGVIIRVGDRTSIFHSALTYFLTQQAAALQKKDRTFRYQRALMPGGTCEATVYDVYGFTAASICVPLGNYHNMDREKKRIGPEYIDLNDWRNMVKLFVQVARNGHTFEPGHKALKQRIEKRFAKLKKLL